MTRSFRKIGGRKYLSWAKWEEGQFLIAKFVKQFEDNYGNPGYEVVVIESDVPDWNENDIVGLNSSGSLNYKMQEVLPGTVVQFTYEGKDTLNKPGHKFNGKEFHVVDVQVDEDSVPDEAASIKAVQDKGQAQAKQEAEPESYDL